MSQCESRRGIDESIFQTPNLLHMTLGTLALMDDVEREQAAEILHLSVEKLDVKFLEHVQVLYIYIFCIPTLRAQLFTSLKADVT